MIFEAKYGGRCGACDEAIKPGDECAYSDDVVVHADCPEPTDPLAPARAVCGRCFMEPAANGECGCDE